MTRIFVFAILMVSYFNVMSQETISIAPVNPTEKIRNELLQTIQSFTEAWSKSDTVALGKLLANEYRHTDIWGKILHRQDWLSYAAMARKISNIITTDVEILLYNNNLASITGKMSYQFGEEKISQEIRFTQFWSISKGHWQRTTFQATLIDKAK